MGGCDGQGDESHEGSDDNEGDESGDDHEGDESSDDHEGNDIYEGEEGVEDCQGQEGKVKCLQGRQRENFGWPEEGGFDQEQERQNRLEKIQRRGKEGLREY